MCCVITRIGRSKTAGSSSSSLSACSQFLVDGVRTKGDSILGEEAPVGSRGYRAGGWVGRSPRGMVNGCESAKESR